MTTEQVELPFSGLYGELCSPEPISDTVALIWPGSGPTDSDGNQPGLVVNNLLDLSQALAKYGIASLRVDKRGVGRSRSVTISEDQLRFDTYMQDAEQWIAWLKQVRRFRRVILLGHSEGALVMTLAAQKISVDRVVALCAPLRRASKVLRDQLAGRLSDDLKRQHLAILQTLEKDQPSPACPPELQVLYRASVQAYLRSWFRYDPQTESQRLDIPMLWLWGQEDQQLPQEWRYLTLPAQHHIIANMNHSMQDAQQSEQLGLHRSMLAILQDFIC